MKYTPHPYQQHATHYIQTHPQALLILQMGLGKTIITLTALNNMMNNTYTVARPLIIAPLRVARDTWPEELTKWDHLTHLTHTTITGTQQQRLAALNTQADIHIINRENIPWLIQHCGNHWPYDTIVIDELSSFKNHKSQRFKALNKIRPHIKRIIGLTGTPAPNNLIDLWAPLKLIDQGQRLEPTLTAYRNKYFHPGKHNGHIVYEWIPNKGADSLIHNAIKDITLSMKTTDHLNLPPATTTTTHIHLNPKAAATYNQLKHDMITTINTHTIDAGSAGVLAGKLQQLAGGAIYTNPDTHEWTEIHDAKLQALDDIIEQAQGNTILIAYWYTHDLARLQHRYPQGRHLNTTQDMADWKAGRIPIAFIHPASAGHGLNLQTGGHILIWYTLTWSLELYEQTNARLNRQGQTHPVTIIHLATTNTIDDNILKALQRKETTQTALIDAVKAHLTNTPDVNTTKV